MRRVVTIAAVLHSLLIVPALCVGGVITHACDCDGVEETCCPSECDCEAQSGCGHESECSDDPCSVPFVRTDRQGDNVIAAAQPAFLALVFLNEGEQPSFKAIAARWDVSLPWHDKPYPSSDLPLLI